MAVSMVGATTKSCAGDEILAFVSEQLLLWGLTQGGFLPSGAQALPARTNDEPLCNRHTRMNSQHTIVAWGQVCYRGQNGGKLGAGFSVVLPRLDHAPGDDCMYINSQHTSHSIKDRLARNGLNLYRAC